MTEERRPIVLCLAMAGAVLIFGGQKIAGEHERVRLGYELTEARRALAGAEEENRRLRLEYSVLISPERIRPLATALGMARPGPHQIRAAHTRGRMSDCQNHSCGRRRDAASWSPRSPRRHPSPKEISHSAIRSRPSPWEGEGSRSWRGR